MSFGILSLVSQITKTSCGSSVKIYKTLSKGFFKLLLTLHLDSSHVLRRHDKRIQKCIITCYCGLKISSPGSVSDGDNELWERSSLIIPVMNVCLLGFVNAINPPDHKQSNLSIPGLKVLKY